MIKRLISEEKREEIKENFKLAKSIAKKLKFLGFTREEIKYLLRTTKEME